MSAFYSWLEKSDFPTLYAATNPGDDFADSYATYVHGVIMNKPYDLQILRNGKVIKSFHLCWNEPWCAKNRQLLEKYMH